MTEDIRERFEKWHVDKFGYVPIWNRSRQQYAGRSREMAEIWQAALSSARTSGTPSAPDRAEELAQDKFAELRSFLTNMRRDAADAEDPELSEYAQAIEQRLDELASLLREAMGRE